MDSILVEYLRKGGLNLGEILFEAEERRYLFSIRNVLHSPGKKEKKR